MECIDVDECDLQNPNHTCDAQAFCLNNEGSFTCECNKGFSGNGHSCFDIDECSLESDNCNIDTICKNTNGSYSCQQGIFKK